MKVGMRVELLEQFVQVVEPEDLFGDVAFDQHVGAAGVAAVVQHDAIAGVGELGGERHELVVAAASAGDQRRPRAAISDDLIEDVHSADVGDRHGVSPVIVSAADNPAARLGWHHNPMRPAFQMGWAAPEPFAETHRGVLATTGYALAPVATREKMLYIGSIATADDLGQRDFEKYPSWCVRPSCRHSRAIRSGNGPASKAASGSASSPRTMPSGTRRLAVSRRRSRIAAANRAENLAAYRHQGFRAVSPDARERHRCRLCVDGRADVLQFPKQLRAAGYKKPISAAAPTMTSSSCPRWATAGSAPFELLSPAEQTRTSRTLSASERAIPPPSGCRGTPPRPGCRCSPRS